MLPSFEKPPLTESRLSDVVIEQSLERENLTHVSIQTARDACFKYMTRASVWDKELESFREESSDERNDGFPILDSIGSLAYCVDVELLLHDISEYRKSLSIPEIKHAMDSLGIEADPELMSCALAAYVVGKEEKMDEFYLMLNDMGFEVNEIESVFNALSKE